MIRLRPYKSCDSKVIVKWVSDEDVFIKWGGERFGKYPISADIIDDKYTKANGDCEEPDNFYPWTAINEDNKVVGHFIMRYTGGDNKQLRFGWVVVDNTLRGKGYGKQMLMKGLKYAFDIMGVERVTIGVFENNEAAHMCYRNVGFVETETVEDEPCNVIEMEILRKDYITTENN